jgi:hypothetical protein
MEHAAIYKMTNPTQTDKVYYGSTMVPLEKRWGAHKAKYDHYKSGATKYRVSAFDVIEPAPADFVIELIEDCSSLGCRAEMRQRERFYIENNPCVNKNIPGRNQEESSTAYYFKNKDKIAMARKEYYKNNKDEIIKKCREYQAKNSEKFHKYQLEYQRKLRQEAKAFRNIAQWSQGVTQSIKTI